MYITRLLQCINAFVAGAHLDDIVDGVDENLSVTDVTGIQHLLDFFYNVVDVLGLYNQIDLLLGEQRNLGIFFDCKFLVPF